MEIELGHDAFEAKVIAQACRAEGLDVQLRLADETFVAPGPALEAHRLVIHGADLAEVREIVARSISANSDLQRLDHKRPWTAGRIIRYLVASVLSLTIAVPVITEVLKLF
jgi:hypothetical protein